MVPRERDNAGVYRVQEPCVNILNALQNCGFFRFRHSAIAAKVPAKFARITAGAGAGACLGLATLAMALSVPASAQTVTLRDPAFDLSPVHGNNSAPWVPGFLRDRPLGLVVGIQPSFEGSGDLVPTYGLASDYSNAFSARSPLQTMGSIDIPLLDMPMLKMGIAGNLLPEIKSEGPREGLDRLLPSITAGAWGSAGVETLSVDVKVLGQVWAPELFENPREGYEAQFGMTFYTPLGRLGGGRNVDLAVRADVTMADDAYMNQHFGISASEAAASGLDAFTASAGLKSMGVAAGLVLPLSRNFELQGKVGVTQLLQDAAASPWVVERGESTDLNGNIGFAFRF